MRQTDQQTSEENRGRRACIQVGGARHGRRATCARPHAVAALGDTMHLSHSFAGIDADDEDRCVTVCAAVRSRTLPLSIYRVASARRAPPPSRRRPRDKPPRRPRHCMSQGR